MNAREMVVTDLSTIRTRRQQWAWDGFLPLGVPAAFAGRGGIGKSTIGAWIAAGLTRGTLPGDFYGLPVNVGFISGEDDPATTLVPRLIAAGADLSRVHDFSGVRTTDKEGNSYVGLPTIADDLALLKSALIANETRALFIDPVMSMMSGDSIKASDVRRNLDPVAALAAELNIAPIMVMHFGKGQGDASDKMSGSHAFRDVARSVLLLAVDEETDQRILTVDKSNYSNQSPSLAFSIESVDVATDDGETATLGLARLVGETALTVHELVRRSHDDALGDLSSDILAFIKSVDGKVSTADVADALDEPLDRVRTYLGRLARSERITRVGRGQYSRNDGVPTVPTVLSVSFNHPNDTHSTHDTGGTPTKTCAVCGVDLHPSLLAAGIYVHPNCQELETTALRKTKESSKTAENPCLICGEPIRAQFTALGFTTHQKCQDDALASQNPAALVEVGGV